MPELSHVDEQAQQMRPDTPSLQEARVLVAAKYALAKVDVLTDEEQEVIDAQPEDVLYEDYRLGFFDNRLTVSRLSWMKMWRDFSDLEEIYMRLAGAYIAWRILSFMFMGLHTPNVFQALSLSESQGAFMLFDLPFLWRLNDMRVQTLTDSYRRLSDVHKLDAAECVSMLLGRYLFISWFFCWVVGGLWYRATGTDYMYPLEFMAHVMLCLRLMPILQQELSALCAKDHYARAENPFMTVLSESLQSMQGYAVFANRLRLNIVEMGTTVAPLLDPHGRTAYQTWRLAEFGVSVLGTLPPNVTDRHLLQLVDFFAEQPDHALQNNHTIAVDDVVAEDALWQERCWQTALTTREQWGPLLLNSLDGRVLMTLIHSYHAVYFTHHGYAYRYKLQTLRRGSALLLERPDLIMFVAQMVMPNTNFFASRMTEFMRALLEVSQEDEIFRHRLIYFADLASSQKMEDDFFYNLVLLALRSDLFDQRPRLLSVHVTRFLHDRALWASALLQDPASLDFHGGEAVRQNFEEIRQKCSLDQALLLFRYFARILSQSSSRTASVNDTLHFLRVCLESAMAVRWTADEAGQTAIINVWQQLATYIAQPSQPALVGQDLESAVTRLARLPDEACVMGSVDFAWALFDCVNTICRGAHIVEEVCSRPFRQLVAEQMLIYLDDEHVEYLRELFGQRIDEHNRADVICCFLDLTATLIAYDFPGCFQKSFENAIDCNDFFDLRAGKRTDDQTVPYYDLTARLVQSVVRFIDHVEDLKCTHNNSPQSYLSVLNQDQSMIFCLGLFFEYIGKGRIYAADWLANMMYRNVFDNPHYLKWSLLWLDASFAGLSLLRGVFLRSERLQWRHNLWRLCYGSYFVLTRAIWHVPRAIYFVLSMSVILLGTMIYNLDYIIFRTFLTSIDHMKIILACVCAVGSVAIALTWGLPPVCLPGVMCVVYSVAAWFLEGVNHMLGQKEKNDTSEVHAMFSSASSYDFAPPASELRESARSTLEAANVPTEDVSVAEADTVFWVLPEHMRQDAPVTQYVRSTGSGA